MKLLLTFFSLILALFVNAQNYTFYIGSGFGNNQNLANWIENGKPDTKAHLNYGFTIETENPKIMYEVFGAINSYSLALGQNESLYSFNERNSTYFLIQANYIFYKTEKTNYYLGSGIGLAKKEVTVKGNAPYQAYTKFTFPINVTLFGFYNQIAQSKFAYGFNVNLGTKQFLNYQLHYRF